jgi:hypothetical protein
LFRTGHPTEVQKTKHLKRAPLKINLWGRSLVKTSKRHSNNPKTGQAVTLKKPRQDGQETSYQSINPKQGPIGQAPLRPSQLNLLTQAPQTSALESSTLNEPAWTESANTLPAAAKRFADGENDYFQTRGSSRTYPLVNLLASYNKSETVIEKKMF